MEVILLERVAKLGQMGDVVRVKDGFGRNFLLPQGKALRATDANKAKFEVMKVDLQAKKLILLSEVVVGPPLATQVQCTVHAGVVGIDAGNADELTEHAHAFGLHAVDDLQQV